MASKLHPECPLDSSQRENMAGPVCQLCTGLGLGFSPVLRPRLGSNQKISFRANWMLNGSPGPIPGAPL